jgi:UDP-N-acetylglucosamine--N-acetylmuramyl-(pentapeptide) pyrophosphoryl-undecaprenol N-acetylglucosamine transferase
MSSRKKISVLITGGGQGGHVYPAITVAKLLREDPVLGHLAYIGCRDSLEQEVATKEGIEFHSIYAWELPRQLTPRLIPWAWDTAVAVTTAFQLLLRIKPDAILGTGAFVSGPVLLAATALRIPYIIHEADVYPGLVNRVMAPFARQVSLGHDAARAHMRSQRFVVNGNPLRPGFTAVDRGQAIEKLGLSKERKTILAIGGALGSPHINLALAGCAKALVARGYQVIHQTGKANYDETVARAARDWPEWRDSPHYRVNAYLEDPSAFMAATDLAISRSGALSLTEFCAYGLPSILVPFAKADQDHQTHNARAMERAGASICLLESECTPERLEQAVASVLGDPERQARMQAAARPLYVPNAAERLTEMVKNLALEASR